MTTDSNSQKSAKCDPSVKAEKAIGESVMLDGISAAQVTRDRTPQEIELESLRKQLAEQSGHAAMVRDFSASFQTLSPTVMILFGQLGSAISQWNTLQGFWESDNPAEKLCLMHSELSEALEALRGDNRSEKLPGLKGEEEELADCIIRILDYAGKRQLRLGQAVMAKLTYNLNRPRKHGKEF